MLYRCWSQLGKQGGRQELSLDRNGCRFVSISLSSIIDMYICCVCIHVCFLTNGFVCKKQENTVLLSANKSTFIKTVEVFQKVAALFGYQIKRQS